MRTLRTFGPMCLAIVLIYIIHDGELLFLLCVKGKKAKACDTLSFNTKRLTKD